jgi:hypothetical protein
MIAGSCGRGTTETCLETYLDPPIALIEATDATNGTALAEVTLSNVRFNDVTVPDLHLLLFSEGPYQDVTVLGDELFCPIPCGFGVGPGKYEMTVRHVGYADKSLAVQAAYAKTEREGCLTSHSQGALVRIELDPL